MDRRNFVRLGVAGGIAAMFSPALATAATQSSGASGKMAGGVFYTRANPGRWSKKISGHLPVIETAQDKIQVVTGHAMKGYEHYITKHMLLDSNFSFLDEFMFDPTKHKAAKSEFSTKNYSGKIYVLSHCNKHDTWMNTIEI